VLHRRNKLVIPQSLSNPSADREVASRVRWNGVQVVLRFAIYRRWGPPDRTPGND